MLFQSSSPAAARYATPADMAAGVKFCTINVSLDAKSMIAKVCSRGLTLSADRGGNIRLACHGTIENIKLGEFHPLIYRRLESRLFFGLQPGRGGADRFVQSATKSGVPLMAREYSQEGRHIWCGRAQSDLAACTFSLPTNT